MKDKLKNPKVTTAIVIIAVIVFGAVVIALGGNDNTKTADSTKNDSSKQEESKDKDSNSEDESKVESAETTTPDLDATSQYSGYTAPVARVATAANTAPVTTPSPTPSTPAPVEPTPPVVPPTEPEEPPTEEPEPVCEVNGRVVVQIGGVSCSYTIATEDGSVVQWELPWARAHSDDGSTVNDTDTSVYVVIESQSEAGEDEPWTAASITYHYRATETATTGDFTDEGGDLTFYTYDEEGELDQDFSQPVTVTEPAVTP
jgi:hypothetical protein